MRTHPQHTRCSAPPFIPTRCASLLIASLSCQSFSLCSAPKKNVFFCRPCDSFKKQKGRERKRRSCEKKRKKKKRNTGGNNGPEATLLKENTIGCPALNIFLSASHVPVRWAEARGTQAQGDPLGTCYPGEEGKTGTLIHGTKFQVCCCLTRRY